MKYFHDYSPIWLISSPTLMLNFDPDPSSKADHHDKNSDPDPPFKADYHHQNFHPDPSFKADPHHKNSDPVQS